MPLKLKLFSLTTTLAGNAWYGRKIGKSPAGTESPRRRQNRPSRSRGVIYYRLLFFTLRHP